MILALILIFCPTPSNAGEDGKVVVDNNHKVIFGHEFPQMDDRLVQVGFWSRKYRIPKFSSHGSELYAWYETKDEADIQKFAFVQFIQGCRFSSFMNGAEVVTRFEDARAFLGKYVLFLHDGWELDSIDIDPMYWSTHESEGIRHQSLRVGGTDTTFPSRLMDVPSLGSKNGVGRRVFVTDIPSAGDVRRNTHIGTDIASNVSMKFRTCLYRVEDVPMVINPKNTNFATPIVCYFWDNSYVYDHERRVMTSPDTVAPACKKETVAKE